jgi:hypothetical protein
MRGSVFTRHITSYESHDGTEKSEQRDGAFGKKA